MLRLFVNNIRCVSYALETNCWRTHLVSLMGGQQRWKSNETRSYKAAILEEFDKKLTIESINNRTKLGDGMVRVSVKYCSLNLIDVQYLEEKNDDILLPMIPGSEFSGEVLEIGDNCKQNFKSGDKIAALLAHKNLGGGLAEECVVSEDECFDVGSVSLKNAAVLLQGHGSALLAFTKHCELKENDIVIVIAGPGGNGLAAIQLASSVFKAKVFAICDTEDSSALIRDEGANQSISIKEGSSKVYKFLDNALEGKKAKVVYDAVGGGSLHLTADFIDPNGFMLTADPFYSAEEFQKVKPDFKKPLSKKEKEPIEAAPVNQTVDLASRITLVDLSEYRINELDVYRQIIQDTLSLCEEEIISPYISRSFSLNAINDAVKFIKEKKCTGKILIDLKATDDETTSDKESDKD